MKIQLPLKLLFIFAIVASFGLTSGPYNDVSTTVNAKKSAWTLFKEKNGVKFFFKKEICNTNKNYLKDL